MDTLTDDQGWQIPPDGYCAQCQWPYRYETSDAKNYQRWCCIDCEQAAAREAAQEAE